VLTAALESQPARVSNRPNEVIKQLTAWTCVILVPTPIAGLCGMDFEHMPEVSWTFGYPLALGTMLAAAAVHYTMFRCRGL
jgi:magnesium transporter